MSHRHRVSLVLSALLLVVPLLFAQGIAKPEKPAPVEEVAGFSLPVGDLASHLEVAEERIAKKDWPVVTTLLQKVLDLPEDQFAYVVRDGRKVLVNAQVEAARLIHSLPKDGQLYYRTAYGPAATELLKQARMFKEPAMFAEVWRRYPHTSAGIEAAERLATHFYDRGNYNLAAVGFERLIHEASLDGSLTPQMLFKACLAFQRAGRNELLGETLKTLEKKLIQDKLTIGERRLTFEEAKKEIERRKPEARQPRSDWPMFRGDAGRNASATGGVPFLEPLWKFDTVNEGTTRNRIKEVTDYLARAKQPLLVSLHPLGVVLKRAGGETIPLVISRDWYGIRARALQHQKKEELKAGEIYWEAPSTWSMERMIKEPKHVGMLSQWLTVYINNRVRPQVLFENSTVGCLCADSNRVYAVEDFQVPPYNPGGQPFGPPARPGGYLGEAMNHNRLQAYELDSGKLAWEIGSAGGKGDLNDSFFLSVPLVLDGKLFVLNEKDKGLRLLVLDPATGNLIGKPHKLGDFREKIQTDGRGRFAAAHLTHSQGILICPTQSGLVLGVELLTGRTLWAYTHKSKPASPVPGKMIGPPGMILTPEGRWVPVPPELSLWRDSPPLVSGRHVIIAPPDGTSVSCLDLHDGHLIWSKPAREGDLYIGGILDGRVLIVGDKTCRALDLADGKEAWNVDTGTPSGFGVIAGGRYLLPLARGAKSKEPEIVVLDVAKGLVVSRIRSRKKETPGNLIFLNGMLVSQTATTLAVYPTIESENKRIDQLLAKNPKDPEGLAGRGEMKLDRGDLAAAIADFRAALDGKPEKALQARLKEQLYEVLSEYLQRDFAAAEKLLPEFEKLARDRALPDDGTLEQRRQLRAEQNRRLSHFLMVVGRGREQQGKRVEAARLYVELAGVGGTNEMLSPPDDPGLKVAPAVWVRQRIEKLLQTATPEEKKLIEQEMAELLKKARLEKDSAGLRNLVAVAGVKLAAGREARLELAERKATRDFLEAEQLLLEVRAQKHDRLAAARAVDQLAGLCMREGLLADAIRFYKELSRDFPKLVIRDGKTGADIFNETLTDKRLLPALAEDEKPVFVPGQVPYKVREVKGDFPAPDLLDLECGGEMIPFFRQHRLALWIDPNPMQIVDRVQGKEVWRGELGPASLSEMTILATGRAMRFQNLGHLVTVRTGQRVIGLDPVGRRILWNVELWDEGKSKVPTYRSHVYNPADGSLKITYDGWTQRLSPRGAIEPGVAIFHWRNGLLGADPLTGRMLWSRSGLAKDLDLFHDGEHLFVVELDDMGQPQATHLFEMATGISLKAADFSDVYRKRLKSHGGTLILTERDNRNNLILRQHDVLANKDRWSKTFAPGSLVLETEEDNLAGAVQPDGKVSVFALDSGKELFKAAMREEHLKNVESVFLLRDASGFYLACRKPRSSSSEAVEANANLGWGTGLTATAVNGPIYRFDADGGLRWFVEVEGQMLITTSFKRRPVIILSAGQRYAPPPAKRSKTRIYDKKTGKLLFDQETAIWIPIHAISIDDRSGIVEVIRADDKLCIEPRDKK